MLRGKGAGMSRRDTDTLILAFLREHNTAEEELIENEAILPEFIEANDFSDDMFFVHHGPFVGEGAYTPFATLPLLLAGCHEADRCVAGGMASNTSRASRALCWQAIRYEGIRRC